MENTQEQKLYAEIVQKAWEDALFKKELIKNPEETIGKLINREDFTSQYKIIVEDQSDESNIFINIPRKIDASELELTTEQLEMVSGGVGSISDIVDSIFYSSGAGWGMLFGEVRDLLTK